MIKRMTVRIVAMVLVLAAMTGFGMAYESGLYDFGTHDLGGQTVTLIMLNDQVVHLDDYFEGDGAGLIEAAEEEFNCNIEIQPHSFSGYMEHLTTRFMAGDSDYDIWALVNGPHWIIRMAHDGLLFPMSEILSSDYYSEYLPPYLEHHVRLGSYQGELYGFGSALLPSGPVDAIELVAFNRVIIEREGLPSPHDLYRDGEWTWEAMRDLGERARRDTTGDGEIDQLGIADGNGFYWNTTYLAASNNAPLQTWRDGRLVFVGHEERFVSTIEYVYDLYDREILDGGRQDFIDGNAALFFNAPGWYQTRVAEMMEDDFGVLPHPAAPWMEDGRANMGGMFSATVLPANSADPEAMVALKHFLLPQENYNPERHFRNAVHDRDSFEILMDLYTEAEFVSPHIISQTFDSSDIFEGIQTPAVAMAEQAPELQVELDEILDQ